MCVFLYKLYDSSAKYPQGHQILRQHSPEILSAFPVHMCRGTIMYKGRETIMTAAMEQILCEGRNFEHELFMVASWRHCLTCFLLGILLSSNTKLTLRKL